jgi:hypothetical protein
MFHLREVQLWWQGEVQRVMSKCIYRMSGKCLQTIYKSDDKSNLKYDTYTIFYFLLLQVTTTLHIIFIVDVYFLQNGVCIKILHTTFSITYLNIFNLIDGDQFYMRAKVTCKATYLVVKRCQFNLHGS